VGLLIAGALRPMHEYRKAVNPEDTEENKIYQIKSTKDSAVLLSYKETTLGRPSNHIKL
jgi:hypothetical protein